MNIHIFRALGGAIVGVLLCVAADSVTAQGGGESPPEALHGLAMYGDPALPADYAHLPHANPDAPRGGRIVLGNPGSFDNLNPYTRKGSVPWQLRFFTHDSLMGRNYDEPFSVYGLLAESVRVPEDRSWVEFTLREEARFSDGSPVTVEDVIWSYETLGTEGHPRYLTLWTQIESIAATGPRSVRIEFAEDNRELALIAGLRPILQKAQWEGKDFANAPLSEVPIGAGPYVVADYEAGRYVTLARDPDYWGADLPFRRGTYNFDEIRIDFYGDGSVLFEAFKAGEIDAMREFNAEDWRTQYSFPAVQSGDVVKTEIPHSKPSGMTGFAMNTRRPPLDDWRVREALIQAFNFEYINEALNGAQAPRITSYFSGSPLAMEQGPAQGRVRDLLAPFADTLPPGALQGYALPVSDGSARNRAGLRRALELLNEAGFTPQEGVMRGPDGAPLAIDIVISKNNLEHQAISDIYLQALDRLGIVARIDRVDEAQFFAREGEFDFDLITYRRALSLSPGNEQRFYWGSEAAGAEGSRNLPGIAQPAIDAMIDHMLAATDPAEFTAAVRAMDRALMAGRYVIPFYAYDVDRIAHVRQMKRPGKNPLYGDGSWYMPQFWWWED